MGFEGPQSALKQALSDLNNSLAESPEWRLPGGPFARLNRLIPSAI